MNFAQSYSKQHAPIPERAVQVNARCILFKNATSQRTRRQMSSPGSKGKGGKGKGKYKNGKRKGKGDRIVTVSNGTDARQHHTSDRRAVIKQKMLSPTKRQIN